MLALFCEHLELRGITNKTSAKGNVYYVAHLESPEGVAHQFFVPKADAFDHGLKKGDKVKVTFSLYYFNDEPRLNVVSIKKEV